MTKNFRDYRKKSLDGYRRDIEKEKNEAKQNQLRILYALERAVFRKIEIVFLKSASIQFLMEKIPSLETLPLEELLPPVPDAPLFLDLQEPLDVGALVGREDLHLKIHQMDFSSYSDDILGEAKPFLSEELYTLAFMRIHMESETWRLDIFSNLQPKMHILYRKAAWMSNNNIHRCLVDDPLCNQPDMPICTVCEQAMKLFRAFVTAFLLARTGYYRDEVVVTDEQYHYTEISEQKKKGGKKKIVSRPVNISYRSFDISMKPVVLSEKPPSETPQQKLSNWLKLHDPEEIIVDKKSAKAHDRTIRRPDGTVDTIQVKKSIERPYWKLKKDDTGYTQTTMDAKKYKKTD